MIPMRLNIGSGKYGPAGWTTLDADPASGAHIIASIPPLPLSVTEHSGEWQEVQMIHVLEHFYQWDAIDVLAEIYKILAVNGRLIIELPNLNFAASVLAGVTEAIKGAAPGQCDMWPIYGDPTHRNPLYVHRWGYTPQTLSAALESAGFAIDSISQAPAQYHVPERDFRMEAVKR